MLLARFGSGSSAIEPKAVRCTTCAEPSCFGEVNHHAWNSARGDLVHAGGTLSSHQHHVGSSYHSPTFRPADQLQAQHPACKSLARLSSLLGILAHKFGVIQLSYLNLVGATGAKPTCFRTMNPNFQPLTLTNHQARVEQYDTLV